MKKLLVIMCAALIACLPCASRDKSKKEAERAALISAINERNFNVEITQNIPKVSGEAVEQYTGDGYIIRVRGEKATLFIPGVNKGGSMQFGGGTTGLGAAELVEATCELKSHKGKTWKYVLKQINSANNEITLLVSENGSVRVSVDRPPMTHFAFYGDASVPGSEAL